MEKHALVETLHLYTEHSDEQDIPVTDVNHTEVSNENDILPCTPKDAKFVCSSAEVGTHRKINLESTPLDPEIQETFDMPCEEYKEIFSLHQGDIDHTKLIITGSNTEDHPTNAKKLYTLWLKDNGFQKN